MHDHLYAPEITNYDVAVFGNPRGPFYSCRRVVEDEDGIRAVEPKAPPQDGEFAVVYKWLCGPKQWRATSDHVDIETACIVAREDAGADRQMY